jgi:hypothetical protein
VVDSDGALAPLARWSRALWLVSGALTLVYSSLYGAEAFLGTYPSAREFVGPVAYIVAFVALLGLAPALADRRPRLARAGAVLAVLGAAGFLLNLLAGAGVVPEEATWVGAGQLVLILVGMTLSFLVFGAASLRSGAFSRTVGALLLAPVVVMGLNLGVVAAGLASPEARFVVSGLWGLSFLAIGFTLRSEGTADGRSKPTPDAAP